MGVWVRENSFGSGDQGLRGRTGAEREWFTVLDTQPTVVPGGDRSRGGRREVGGGRRRTRGRWRRRVGSEQETSLVTV